MTPDTCCSTVSGTPRAKDDGTYILEPFDPCPLRDVGVLENTGDHQQDLMALTIETKYLFVDDQGNAFHQYMLPNDADVHNAGGYIDKVIKYRHPDLYGHLAAAGINRRAFQNPRHPILASRSPQLDLLLFDLITHLRDDRGHDRVSLFDLGCTVAEHWDLLDIMLRIDSDQRHGAATALSYHGLDKSAMLLSMAKMLHPSVASDHFRLTQAEGSAIDFPAMSFDLSLSVGVVNRVDDPMGCLDKLLHATRHACVLALWVSRDEAMWTLNHAGVPFYFFSRRDLLELEAAHPGARFVYTDYIPESESSQQKHYIGLGSGKIRRLGCYHLVFTRMESLPFETRPLGSARERTKLP